MRSRHCRERPIRSEEEAGKGLRMRSKLDWSYLTALVAVVTLILAAALPFTTVHNSLDDLVGEGRQDPV